MAAQNYLNYWRFIESQPMSLYRLIYESDYDSLLNLFVFIEYLDRSRWKFRRVMPAFWAATEMLPRASDRNRSMASFSNMDTTRSLAWTKPSCVVTRIGPDSRR